MLGRLLCRLGVHDNMASGRSVDPDSGWIHSVWGYCLRCNEPWQLDNVSQLSSSWSRWQR